ncbi:MAG: hypothetical protein ACFFFB_12110 [Candidatus Heimdallarchaeota archaeon]
MNLTFRPNIDVYRAESFKAYGKLAKYLTNYLNYGIEDVCH